MIVIFVILRIAKKMRERQPKKLDKNSTILVIGGSKAVQEQVTLEFAQEY